MSAGVWAKSYSCAAEGKKNGHPRDTKKDRKWESFEPSTQANGSYFAFPLASEGAGFADKPWKVIGGNKSDAIKLDTPKSLLSACFLP